MPPNIHAPTVEHFGREWAAFDQSGLSEDDSAKLFSAYFSLFDFNPDHEGFDLGCGSGRWAKHVAPRVRFLHCIEPSDAVYVARRNLADRRNVLLYPVCVDKIPLPDGSQDFGYALGVLHHVPDPKAALRSCVVKLKPGGQFLLYLYYRFDNRPFWFRLIWRATNLFRRVVSRLPFVVKRMMTEPVAAFVYWPLARLSRLLEKAGFDVDGLPLSGYRNLGYYTMRTDALDRFGTRLEHRFTRAEVEAMMLDCGLKDIRFRETAPYWVAVGIRR